MNHRRITPEDGFTLIELLIVIAVIGILAAIAIPAYMNQRAAATESSVKADLRNAGTLLEGQGKFTGAMPEDHNASDGVIMTAMRTSERNNKISSGSQFADGTHSGWGTFKHASSPATVTTEVFTNTTDGYQGMNYRRVTVVEGDNTSIGQTIGMDLPEIGKQGDTYSVSSAIRHNYTGCRSIHIEFKDGGNSWAGGIDTKQVCFTKDQWVSFTHTGDMNADGANRIHFSLYGPMKTGENFDVTGAVLVEGANIDPAAALDNTGYDFCLQAYHQDNPTNIWRYSSLNGGLKKEKC